MKTHILMLLEENPPPSVARTPLSPNSLDGTLPSSSPFPDDPLDKFLLGDSTGETENLDYS